jgi:pyroglutamyl-peptidase
LTGFEPWAEHKRNPSGEVARALGGHVLPVHYGRADRALRRLLRGETPRAVVLTGLAAGRTSIQLESRACNAQHSGRAISPAGPAFRKSTLPLDALLRRLRAEGFPAEISRDAGRFLCNHVFYVARSLWPRIPVGFVHLPPLDVLPRARQIRALRVILRELEAATARGGRRGSPEAARSGAGRGIRRS